MPASPVAIRPVLWFLVLTFALNWGLVGLFLAAGGLVTLALANVGLFAWRRRQA